jgi:hypothetical protein
MNPKEAGFDGAKGIGLNLPSGGVYRLRRGPTPPWETQTNCQNQLLWLESTPPRLLYCNESNEWFELSFTPIQLQ